MTITNKVFNFPTFPISGQVFYIPGAMYEGGFTSGGARIVSQEPGGFGMLQIQPSLQVTEYDYPLSSWLMSKANGSILRVRLAPTPQVCGAHLIRGSGILWAGDETWTTGDLWQNGYSAQYSAAALEGTGTVQIDMSQIGRVLQSGHVIGHKTSTYLIDEIEYDAANIATLTIMPPLRDPVAIGDMVHFRPWFTGMIVNGPDIVSTYEANENGHIQLPKIILSEVILP